MSFWVLSALRTVMTGETDADSPGDEEIMSQLRENFEALMMLLFATGAARTCTSNPSNDANGYFYDAGAGWTDDLHNGRTLLILSGTAIGNMYTIDDTVAASNRIACTGDNLYADGVRSGDSYIILFDVKVNADGHDHDGVNSKYIVGVAPSTIVQSMLKSTTGSVNTGASANLTLPGGTYGFYPQVTGNLGGSYDASIAYQTTGTSYATLIYLSGLGSGHTVSAQQRYVQSSGEIHWVFIQRDKATKAVKAMFEAPDHPCFGNGGDPALVPHPFHGVDMAKDDILVMTLDPSEIRAIRKANPDKNLLDVLATIGVDETATPVWPSQAVTVGLPPDWDDAWLSKRPITPIKVQIPKSADLIHVALDAARAMQSKEGSL